MTQRPPNAILYPESFHRGGKMTHTIKDPEISEEKIREIVREEIKRELGYGKYEKVNLLERMVKVEEAIKFLQEEIKQLREDTNRRFEEMREYMERSNSRMFQFMTLGFSVLVVLITLYKFLK